MFEIAAQKTVRGVPLLPRYRQRAMPKRCLRREILAEKPTLVAEIGKWERRRNGERARIDWLFTVDRAREKLGRAYPPHAGHRRNRALNLAA